MELLSICLLIAAPVSVVVVFTWAYLEWENSDRKVIEESLLAEHRQLNGYYLDLSSGIKYERAWSGELIKEGQKHDRLIWFTEPKVNYTRKVTNHKEVRAEINRIKVREFLG